MKENSKHELDLSRNSIENYIDNGIIDKIYYLPR